MKKILLLTLFLAACSNPTEPELKATMGDSYDWTCKNPNVVLQPATPNPATDFTRIEFKVSKTMQFKMRIVKFNTDKEILASENTIAEGSYTMEWHMKNIFNERVVNPGVYTVILEFDGDKATGIVKVVD